MKTYWKSEAPDNPYYIKYELLDGGFSVVRTVEFWCDNEEDYHEKLGFVERHFNYRLLTNTVPSASL